MPVVRTAPIELPTLPSNAVITHMRPRHRLATDDSSQGHADSFPRVGWVEEALELPVAHHSPHGHHGVGRPPTLPPGNRLASQDTVLAPLRASSGPPRRGCRGSHYLQQ